jgi:threonine aldolase
MHTGFASDNAATVHPAVLEALARANHDHAHAYGHDDYTQGVARRLAKAFGAPDAGVYFVFNGTGANVLCLRALCRPGEAVVCTESSHVNTDEAGAPEAVAGVKLLTLPSTDGKLHADAVERLLAGHIEEHQALPRAVTIAQSTELGSVYSIAELRELGEVVHRHGLLLHLDGSRLANAAAALDTGLSDLRAASGADIVSFGGTKNGIMVGEAVVVFTPELDAGMLRLRKQTLQLASKMRYIAAQFDALLTDELWRANATHSNAMAARLAAAVRELPSLTLTRPVDANVVFATLPSWACRRLQAEFDFYVWDEATGEVRWMCAWDTGEDDVDRFAAAIVRTIAAGELAAGQPSPDPATV